MHHQNAKYYQKVLSCEINGEFPLPLADGAADTTTKRRRKLKIDNVHTESGRGLGDGNVLGIDSWSVDDVPHNVSARNDRQRQAAEFHIPLCDLAPQDNKVFSFNFLHLCLVPSFM